MECKDCSFSVYDEFYEDYLCGKPSDGVLRVYPNFDAPKCKLKQDGSDLNTHDNN